VPVLGGVEERAHPLGQARRELAGALGHAQDEVVEHVVEVRDGHGLDHGRVGRAERRVAAAGARALAVSLAERTSRFSRHGGAPPWQDAE
jgi:hypothetical protein